MGAMRFPAGHFSLPWGIAVHEATGQIFIAERNNHRIQAFRLADETFLGLSWLSLAHIHRPSRTDIFGVRFQSL
jgi:hypothetical protein